MRNPRAVSMLAIIGGSGLYDLPGLTGVRREKVGTPFGAPSDEIVVGRLGEQEIAFLPRHGRGHRLLPTEVNSRANLHALKQLGATRVISVSAVGSMKEEIAPGDLVLPLQYIDRTFARAKTFFGEGIVAHVAFSDPVCPVLHKHLEGACFAAGAKVHPHGTYLCIEGPQFSTRAESELYRSWRMEEPALPATGGARTRGALIDIIGMTALPEAKLAREAELCYATLALATDYDSWHPAHDAVTVEQVVKTLNANAATAREVVRNAAIGLSRIEPRACACAHALDHAVMTSPVPAAARERVALLLGDRFR